MRFVSTVSDFLVDKYVRRGCSSKIRDILIMLLCGFGYKCYKNWDTKNNIKQPNSLTKRVNLIYSMFLYLNFYHIYSQIRKVAFLRYHGFCLITLYYQIKGHFADKKNHIFRNVMVIWAGIKMKWNKSYMTPINHNNVCYKKKFPSTQ